ncbi:MAG: YjbQ family protein [Christensenellaceae bacterium]|nr:YjbQ family protein [Christensenellaceae bacterium]
MLKSFNIETQQNSVINLTTDIKKFVEESGIKSGLCVVFTPHTTAGLTITSFWDPLGFEDLQDEINRIIPTRIDFKHQHDTPTDAAGHIKSSLIGVSIPLIIEDGKLLLGGSQGLFFLEFDGPRKRKYYVKLIKEE